MFKRTLILLALALSASLLAADKSAFDLMLQGRYGEAKAIINSSNLSPRYELLYYALTEADAARACSLYQVIAIRYPKTECDSVSRNRLGQARDIGFVVVPISEWSQAGPEVAPLYTPPPAPVAAAAPEIPAPQTPVSEPVAITAPDTAAPQATIIEPEIPAALPVVPEPEYISHATESSKTALPVVKDEVVSAPVEAVREEPTVAPKPEEPVVSVPEAPVATAAPVETPAEPTPEKQVEEQPPVKPDSVQPRIKAQSEPVRPHDKPAASRGKWYVQVGAFANEANAHRLEKRLQDAGYATRLVPRETTKGTLLQVRVGGYATRAELNEVMPKLKERFSVPTVAVSE